MMKKKFLYSFFIAILSVSSCAIQKSMPPSTMDTSRRESPKELLPVSDNSTVNEDAFIRTIDNNDNKDLTLPIVPPEKPKKVVMVYDTLMTFAVQLKAFGEEEPAKQLVAQLRQVEPDSVFYFEDGYLYKVRIGPYFNRADADKKRNSYKEGSFRGAWVAPHKLIRSHEMEAQENTTIKAPVKVQSKPQTTTSDQKGIYIQIASAGSRANAEQFLRQNQNVSGLQPVIFDDAGRFKIVIGPFSSREEAEKMLPDTRLKFPGAWLITR